MYRVKFPAPDGSEFELEYPTRDRAFEFALRIGEFLRTMPKEDAIKRYDCTVSIVGPTGSREIWSYRELEKEALKNKYLHSDRKDQDANRSKGQKRPAGQSA